MNKRDRLIFQLENLKKQGSHSTTLSIDAVLAALTEPLPATKQTRPVSENWEADGGIWQGPDD